MSMRRGAFPVGMVVLVAMLCAACPAAADDKPAADRADDDYNMAVWLYANRKYDLAVEEFRAFLSKYPDHAKTAEAMLGLSGALVHLKTGDKAVGDTIGEAVKVLEDLRKRFPKFERGAEVLFQLGQAQATRGKAKEAAAAFRELSTSKGDSYLVEWAAIRLGEVLVALRDYKDASAALGPLIDKYVTGKGADKRLKAERGRLDKIRAGLAADFESLLERAYLNLGLAQLGGGDFEASRATFEAFLKRRPSGDLAETARFHLAQSLYRAGQYEPAAEAYRKVAAGKGPLAADAAFEAGLSLYQAQKFKAAADAFADCAKRFPEAERAGRARLYSGTCLYLAGDYKGAAERLGRLAGDDGNAEAAYWLGMAHLKADNPAAARKAFDRVLKAGRAAPRYADALVGKADAAMAEGRTDDAVAAYREFAEQNAGHAERARALYTAAAALHRAGKYDASENLCDLLLAGAAKSEFAGPALFISGENRLLQKKYEAAAERYARLLKDYPESENAAPARFRLAWVAFYGGRYDDALKQLGRIDAKKAGPDLAAEIDYLRGNCLFEKKDYKAAAEALGRCLNAKGAERYAEDAAMKQALALSRSGDADAAADKFQRFIKRHAESPLRPEAEYELAELLKAKGRTDVAAEHYDVVARKFAGHRLAPYALYALGSIQMDKEAYREAAKVYGQLVDKHGASDLAARAMYQKGLAFQKAGQFAEAAQAYRAMLDRFGKDDLASSALLGLGVCLQKQDKFDEAAGVFRRLYDAAGDDAGRERAAYETAWSLQESGKRDEALKAWRTLAEKFPKGSLAADAWFYMAEAAYADKKYADAAALFDKALASSAADRLKDKALYRLGWCRWFEEKFTESAAAFDRLAAEAPRSDLIPEALLQSAEAMTRAGKPAEAISRLEKLLDDRYKTFEHAADARFRLGEAQMLLGRTDQAVETFTALARLYPSYAAMAEVEFNLGKALYEQKKLGPARARFEKALAMTDTEIAARSQFYIGETYLAADDTREALKAYLRVVALWSAYDEWVAAAQFEIGKCYLTLGKTTEAREAFQTVVDKYKDTQWATPAREQLSRLPSP